MTITNDELNKAVELKGQISTLKRAIDDCHLGACTDCSDMNSIKMSWNQYIDIPLRKIKKDIFLEATEAMNKRLELELERVILELSLIIKDSE